jgi:hypothetical protein
MLDGTKTEIRMGDRIKNPNYPHIDEHSHTWRGYIVYSGYPIIDCVGLEYPETLRKDKESGAEYLGKHSLKIDYDNGGQVVTAGTFNIEEKEKENKDGTTRLTKTAKCKLVNLFGLQIPMNGFINDKKEKAKEEPKATLGGKPAEVVKPNEEQSLAIRFSEGLLKFWGNVPEIKTNANGEQVEFYPLDEFNEENLAKFQKEQAENPNPDKQFKPLEKIDFITQDPSIEFDRELLTSFLNEAYPEYTDWCIKWFPTGKGAQMLQDKKEVRQAAFSLIERAKQLANKPKVNPMGIPKPSPVVEKPAFLGAK